MNVCRWAFALSDGLGRTQNLDVLKGRIVRIPKRRKDFDRYESATIIEFAGFSVRLTGGGCSDRLDLQEPDTAVQKPRFSMAEKT